MKYVEKHWKTFIGSMKVDRLTFKLFMTDILFILTLIFAYGMVYALWIKNLMSVSALLGIDETMPAISNMDILGIWNIFITKIMFIIISGVLLYILLISLYSAVSHTFINKKDFTLRLFLNFLGIYSSLTLIYFLLVVMMFFISKNTMFVAWAIIILTMIYVYSLLIFYLVTNSGKFMKIVRHGFKSMIRLHDTIPPLLLGFFMLTLTVLILGIILKKWPVLLTICAVLAFMYMLTWLKRYMHHMIHEV